MIKDLKKYLLKVKQCPICSSKNSEWWKRRYEYHQFVKFLFERKRKKHYKLLDYFLSFFINLFFNK